MFLPLIEAHEASDQILAWLARNEMGSAHAGNHLQTGICSHRNRHRRCISGHAQVTLLHVMRAAYRPRCHRRVLRWRRTEQGRGVNRGLSTLVWLGRAGEGRRLCTSMASRPWPWQSGSAPLPAPPSYLPAADNIDADDMENRRAALSLPIWFSTCIAAVVLAVLAQ